MRCGQLLLALWASAATACAESEPPGPDEGTLLRLVIEHARSSEQIAGDIAVHPGILVMGSDDEPAPASDARHFDVVQDSARMAAILGAEGAVPCNTIDSHCDVRTHRRVLAFTDAVPDGAGRFKAGYVVTVDMGEASYQQANVLLLTRRGDGWVVAEVRRSWHADLLDAVRKAS